jgi:hypothetical protein
MVLWSLERVDRGDGWVLCDDKRWFEVGCERVVTVDVEVNRIEKLDGKKKRIK